MGNTETILLFRTGVKLGLLIHGKSIDRNCEAIQNNLDKLHQEG
jgi:hypothetical protein